MCFGEQSERRSSLGRFNDCGEESGNCNLAMAATTLVPAVVPPVQVTQIGTAAKTALVWAAKHAPVKTVLVAKVSAIPAADVREAIDSLNECLAPAT